MIRIVYAGPARCGCALCMWGTRRYWMVNWSHGAAYAFSLN